MEIISSVIELRQVDLETKIEEVNKILKGIYTLYGRLCNVDPFIQETQQATQRLQA